MDAMKAAVTNQRVADDLGITHSAVSRIRSGDRAPGLEVMMTMHESWGWDLAEQALARKLGTYAEEFERVLAARYV
jgi:transcriptional regulator with XRE-family HTH domain